ncbi:hypothetical protein ADL21_00090 [Streptomyces albus subsp. albus]|nr:hypothetical protein ADL21_00090 [Streptomyces albus subsp. albus]
MARRRRVLGGLLVGTIGLAAGGLGATMFIKSPAQAAAEKAAPPQDVLTAPVEHRVLSDTLVTRGSVTAAQTVTVSPGGPSDKSIARSVVTKVRTKKGASLSFGQVLLEVSGRPLIALRGDLPSYRDLQRGSQGDDVAQLQKALTELGYGIGADRRGTFGAGTEQAVTALYQSRGYAPLSASVRAQPSGTETGEKTPPTPRTAASGPVVPSAEVVFLSSGPLRTDTVNAVVGKEAGDKLLTLSAGRLGVRGFVAAHEKGLVHAGQKVEIFSEVSGEQATGSVVSVADAPAEAKKDGAPDQGGYAVTVKPDRALPEAFSGQDVRLTIEAATSKGKVLAVPSAAISAGADGRTSVTVQGPDRAQHRVEVRTGMSGDGFVQVIPQASAHLAAGDRVVVGTDGGARKQSLE